MKKKKSSLLKLATWILVLSFCGGNSETVEETTPTETATESQETVEETTPTETATESQETVEETTPTETAKAKEIAWGKTVSQPIVYAAADVTQEHIDVTVEWVNKAIELWGNYGPLELWIIGSSPEAAIGLDEKWCEVRAEKDPSWNTQWDCANGDPYGSGEGWSPFYNCVTDGCSSVSTYIKEGLDYYFSALLMSARYPGPEEEDYKKVVLHEYFHVYQHSLLSVPAIDTGDWRKSNRNVYFSNSEVQVPFLMEGGAEYMALYWYAKQPGVNENFLKQAMERNALGIQDYLNDGRSLRVLGFNEQLDVYAINTWFVAYLIHNSSEETFRVDFWSQLESLGFEDAFKANFGKSSDEMIEEFNIWINQPVDVLLQIIS
jgi:hypothetical protein